METCVQIVDDTNGRPRECAHSENPGGDEIRCPRPQVCSRINHPNKSVCVCARVTVGDADHRALQHRPTFYMSTYIDTCSSMMMMLMMTIKRRNIFVFFGSPDAVCSIEKASHRFRPHFDERRDKLFPSLHQEQHSILVCVCGEHVRMCCVQKRRT